MDSQESKRPRCAHFVLAKGSVADVEYCAACAIFHVNVDSMSIRFRATALRDLRDTLSAALASYERALEQLAAGPPPPPGDGLH